jgi:hypothetical protein
MMVGIVVFNLVMLLAGVAVATQIIPPSRLSGMIYYLHGIIGITAPAPDKVKIVALVWLGTVVVIVDGFLFLLVFLASVMR